MSALAMLTFGCGSGQNSYAPPTFPNVTGDWQIQTSLGASTAGPLLQGNLQQSESGVTGIFRYIDVDSSSACSTAYQMATVQGTIDANGKMSLVSVPLATSNSTITIALQLNTVAHGYNGGTIVVQGGSCAYASSPAVGVQINTVTGTYGGSVFTPGTLQGVNGTVTAALVQAQTPRADGQYDLSGNIKFTGTLCSVSLPVTGVLSGDDIVVASQPGGSGTSELTVNAAPDNNALELLNLTLSFASGPCSAGVAPYGTYTGTLTRSQ